MALALGRAVLIPAPKSAPAAGDLDCADFDSRAEFQETLLDDPGERVGLA
jgi:hypothetical protein